MPSFDVVIQVRKHGEIFSVTFHRPQGQTRLVIRPRSIWKKSSRPETQVITHTNHTPWIGFRGRGQIPGMEAFKSGKRQSNAQSPEKIATAQFRGWQTHDGGNNSVAGIGLKKVTTQVHSLDRLKVYENEIGLCFKDQGRRIIRRNEKIFMGW